MAGTLGIILGIVLDRTLLAKKPGSSAASSGLPGSTTRPGGSLPGMANEFLGGPMTGLRKQYHAGPPPIIEPFGDKVRSSYHLSERGLSLEQIVAVQHILTCFNMLSGKPSGVIDAQTRTAIRWFQSRYNQDALTHPLMTPRSLAVDGILGPHTLRAIEDRAWACDRAVLAPVG